MSDPNERKVDDRLADWVDDCMSARERERFVAELRVNPQLRKDLEAYEQTVKAVRAALRAPTVATNVADRVMQAIAAPQSRASSASGRVWRIGPLLASVAAAAALLGLTLWLDSVGGSHATVDRANVESRIEPVTKSAAPRPADAEELAKALTPKTESVDSTSLKQSEEKEKVNEEMLRLSAQAGGASAERDDARKQAPKGEAPHEVLPPGAAAVPESAAKDRIDRGEKDREAKNELVEVRDLPVPQAPAVDGQRPVLEPSGGRRDDTGALRDDTALPGRGIATQGRGGGGRATFAETTPSGPSTGGPAGPPPSPKQATADESLASGWTADKKPPVTGADDFYLGGARTPSPQAKGNTPPIQTAVPVQQVPMVIFSLDATAVAKSKGDGNAKKVSGAERSESTDSADPKSHARRGAKPEHADRGLAELPVAEQGLDRFFVAQFERVETPAFKPAESKPAESGEQTAAAPLAGAPGFSATTSSGQSMPKQWVAREEEALGANLRIAELVTPVASVLAAREKVAADGDKPQELSFGAMAGGKADLAGNERTWIVEGDRPAVTALLRRLAEISRRHEAALTNGEFPLQVLPPWSVPTSSNWGVVTPQTEPLPAEAPVTESKPGAPANKSGGAPMRVVLRFRLRS